jgi:tyrosyl-tRNA synthetase
MLAKDSVKSRLELGISFTEFSYMLLQAYDFLELNRRAGVTLQLGGSDQWGNITAGIELIRRAAGADAHGLVLPLITTASGTKFGKTEAGAVWLDGTRTSPFQFYQFWINTDDRDVGRYLRYFTLEPREEIAALDTATTEHPERRSAQLRLAYDVTARVHGAAAADAAKRVSAVLFGESAVSLTPSDLDLLKAEMPAVDVIRASYAGPNAAGSPSLHIDLIELAVQTGILSSKGEARRLIQQGGFYVNDVRVLPENGIRTDRDLLHGRALIIRKGARTRTFVDFI